SMPHDLVTHFRQYFEIVPADTPDLLEQAFRLRYQVYCQEGCLPGFDPLDYPDGLERDIYDYEHRSVHCLLRHRPTGTNAGTVRLVLADPVRPDALFPIEVAAGEHIDRDYLSKCCAARGTIAECSRFIVAKPFRSRRGEQQWPDGMAEEVLDADRGSGERRVQSHPVLGLIKAAMIMCWEQQVQYLYTAMEPRLDRRLRQFGLELRPVSSLIEYHGPVCAHWGFVPEFLAHAHKLRPEVWRLLTENGKIWPAPRDDAASATQRQAS
ncbi:MAG: PEP-CTERM/exosortase system-associated acyltransferase, partial [Gammaproteobacteria bacterium]